MRVFFYSECKYIGLRSFNQCGSFKTGFVGQNDKNYQNRDLKLKLWEEVAAECDSSCKEVQLKAKLRHTGAWQPLRLCYRPAVFFRHLRLAALSFLRGTIWRAFTKNVFVFY